MLSNALLHQVTVGEVMHEGIVTCSPSADLEQVAAAMAEHGIHCLVAIDEGPPGEDDDRLWGVVSDLDLMRGIESRGERSTPATWRSSTSPRWRPTTRSTTPPGPWCGAASRTSWSWRRAVRSA